LPKTPALLKKILTDIETLEAVLQNGSSGEEMFMVHKCVQYLLEIECPVKIQVYTNCMCLEIETKMDSVKKEVTPGTGPRKCAPSGQDSSVWSTAALSRRVWKGATFAW
jgi:hypothetical protein